MPLKLKSGRAEDIKAAREDFAALKKLIYDYVDFCAAELERKDLLNAYDEKGILNMKLYTKEDGDRRVKELEEKNQELVRRGSVAKSVVNFLQLGFILLKPQLQLIIHPGFLFCDMKLITRQAASNQKWRRRVVELLISCNLSQVVIRVAVFAIVTAGVISAYVSRKIAGTFFS